MEHPTLRAWIVPGWLVDLGVADDAGFVNVLAREAASACARPIPKTSSDIGIRTG
jgi:hypothetical protein